MMQHLFLQAPAALQTCCRSQQVERDRLENPNTHCIFKLTSCLLYCAIKLPAKHRYTDKKKGTDRESSNFTLEISNSLPKKYSHCKKVHILIDGRVILST